MAKYDIEQIEAYLRGTMSQEESKAFESQMASDPELKQEVETMAMDIVAIRQVWVARDQMKIARLRHDMAGASKRMWTAAATIGGVALLAAAMVFTPVYEFVVKPIVEAKKEEKKAKPVQTAPAVKPLIQEEEDTIPGDTIDEEEIVDAEPSVVTKPAQPAPLVKEPEPELTPEPQREIQEEKKVDEPAQVKVQQKTVTYIPTVNKVVSKAQLMDYEISKITAKRVGNKVVCNFTMFNKNEDAEVQMHSARAKDGNGKDYAAKYCTLNGKDKRIIEKWKQNEPHSMEIVIDDVDPSVTYFTQVSFSFQSKGKERNQKSQKIVIEVGDIQ